MSAEDEIGRFLDSSEAIIFVGAGASRWAGLPQWEGLISELIQYTEKKTGEVQKSATRYLKEKDLLGAADVLLKKITLSELSRFLRVDLKFGEAEPHRIHELLVALGPTCFITTNYDRLIEDQLSVVGNKKMRPVTNRQLSEFADIIRADARNFVFKMHGCITDSESIVLSEKSYFDLILGSQASGSRSVLEMIRILFATRPIFFVGYSLRDLDLQLLLRHLQQTFDRNIGRYWAVLPDLEQEDSARLWETYRIRSVSYLTKEEGRDHSALIDLLERLANRDRNLRSATKVDSGDSILAVARYGRRLADLNFESAFEVRAHYSWISESVRGNKEALDYRNVTISNLLREFPGSLILAGPAGAGKSFGIRRYLSQCGEALQSWALDGPLPAGKRDFPILLDARLYEGDFIKLAATTLPPTLTFEDIRENAKPVLIVDSVDEMPSSHLDASTWLSDLKLLVEMLGGCRVVYGTRRSELIAGDDIPVFDVQRMDESFVASYLKERNLAYESLATDVQEVLSTPFGLTLGARILSARSVDTPAGVLQYFIAEALALLELSTDLTTRVALALQQIAWNAMNDGRDTIAISKVISEFRAFEGLDEGLVERLVDRLVEGGIFVSEIDGRVRFVHRAILEYLSGLELASRLNLNGLQYLEVVSSRRWDNALVLSIANFDEEKLFDAMQSICDWDLALALRVARNAEIRRTELLDQVLSRIENENITQHKLWAIEREFKNTRFPEIVLPKLRALALSDHSMKGPASAAIIPYIQETEIKYFIDMLCDGLFDYNSGTLISKALAARFDSDLCDYFISKLVAKNIPEKDKDEDGREIIEVISWHNGISSLISRLDRDLRDLVRDSSIGASRGVRAVVCNVIARSMEPDDFRYLVRQWDDGIFGSTFEMYTHLEHYHSDLDDVIFEFNQVRFSRIKGNLRNVEKTWTLPLLKSLVDALPTWSRGIGTAIEVEDNVFLREVFSLVGSCTRPDAVGLFLERIVTTLHAPSNDDMLLVSLLSGDDCGAHWDKILQLLTSDDAQLVYEIGSEFSGPFFNIPRPLTAEESDTLVGRISHFIRRDNSLDSDGKSHFAVSRLLGVLIEGLDSAGLARLVKRANSKNDAERAVLLGVVICAMPPSIVSSDSLSVESKKLTLEYYFRSNHNHFFLKSPGSIATEAWIESDVLPFLETLERTPEMRILAERVLVNAGSRHGRRYKLPW